MWYLELTVFIKFFRNWKSCLWKCSEEKRIGTITVKNSGSGYENREVRCGVSGINTSLNYINIKNHGFNSGETITYKTVSGSTSISGLTENSDYILTKVDDDNFSLSSVGVGTTAANFFLLLSKM